MLGLPQNVREVNRHLDLGCSGCFLMIFACIYIYLHLEADRAASVDDGFERFVDPGIDSDSRLGASRFGA